MSSSRANVDSEHREPTVDPERDLVAMAEPARQLHDSATGGVVEREWVAREVTRLARRELENAFHDPRMLTSQRRGRRPEWLGCPFVRHTLRERLIVMCARRRVSEGLVGRRERSESLRPVGSGVEIRMMLTREAPVRAADLSRRCVSRHAECLVVIHSLGASHEESPPSLSTRAVDRSNAEAAEPPGSPSLEVMDRRAAVRSQNSGGRLHRPSQTVPYVW
jgi:hypothetical protein